MFISSYVLNESKNTKGETIMSKVPKYQPPKEPGAFSGPFNIAQNNKAKTKEIVIGKALISMDGSRAKIGDAYISSADSAENPIVEGHICLDKNGNKYAHVTFQNGESIKFNPQEQSGKAPHIQMTKDNNAQGNEIIVSNVFGFQVNTGETSSKVFIEESQGTVDVSSGTAANQVIVNNFGNQSVFVKSGENDTLVRENYYNRKDFVFKQPGIYKFSSDEKGLNVSKIDGQYSEDLFK